MSAGKHTVQAYGGKEIASAPQKFVNAHGHGEDVRIQSKGAYTQIPHTQTIGAAGVVAETRR